MPAKAYDPVLQAYVDDLNRLINSTISHDRLVLLELQGGSDVRQIVRFQDGRRLPIRLAPRGFLHFRQLVRRTGADVQTIEALHILSESANPDDEAEWILRYEYDRTPQPGKPQAHLHVNAERKGVPLKHIHFPTGRISVEQLIAHLIMEHGVSASSADALSLLAESHRGFQARRSDLSLDAFP